MGETAKDGDGSVRFVELPKEFDEMIRSGFRIQEWIGLESLLLYGLCEHLKKKAWLDIPWIFVAIPLRRGPYTEATCGKCLLRRVKERSGSAAGEIIGQIENVLYIRAGPSHIADDDLRACHVTLRRVWLRSPENTFACHAGFCDGCKTGYLGFELRDAKMVEAE